MFIVLNTGKARLAAAGAVRNIRVPERPAVFYGYPAVFLSAGFLLLYLFERKALVSSMAVIVDRFKTLARPWSHLSRFVQLLSLFLQFRMGKSRFSGGS